MVKLYPVRKAKEVNLGVEPSKCGVRLPAVPETLSRSTRGKGAKVARDLSLVNKRQFLVHNFGNGGGSQRRHSAVRVEQHCHLHRITAARDGQTAIHFKRSIWHAKRDAAGRFTHFGGAFVQLSIRYSLSTGKIICQARR